MTILTGAGKRFLEELPLGVHVLSEGSPSDTVKCALYGPNASLSPNTNAYTTSGEVSGGGYTAGGVAVPLTVVGKSGSARNAGAQFANPYIQPTDDTEFSIAGVGVRGCALYNATQGNRIIFTLDFGAIVTPSVGIIIKWGLSGVLTETDRLIPLVGNNF